MMDRVNNPSEMMLGTIPKVRFFGSDLFFDLIAIALVATIMFWYAGVGYEGSDDAGYINCARRWLESGPLVSNFFGDLRYPIILPIAVSISLFGDSEFSVAVPNFCYALGTVVATYFGLRALVDRATGLLAAVLLSFLPLLGGLATTVSDDICELLFIVISLWVFLWGIYNKSGGGVFFIAGVA